MSTNKAGWLSSGAEGCAVCLFFVFTCCCHSGVRQLSHASKRGWMGLKRRAEVDAFCFFFVFTCCCHFSVKQLSRASKQGWMALKRRAEVDTFCVSLVFACCSHSGLRAAESCQQVRLDGSQEESRS